MNLPLRHLIRLLRPSQWIKNILVLAPPFFGGALFGDPSVLIVMAQAFLAFSLISSAGYVANDIVDADFDRNHSRKKLRPLASANVSKSQAGVAFIAAAALGTALSAGLGGKFLLIALLYLGVSLLYSLTLQHIVILDVFTIAAGFALRILAGGAASGVDISSWLILTTFLLSLFLALGKRRAELALSPDSARFRRVLERYTIGFLDMALNVFATTAIVTYSIYSVRRGPDEFVYTVPLVCYGILRYMYLLQTGKAQDPAETLMGDRWLFSCVALWLFITGLLIHSDYLLGFLK
ncbi:MAG: decaprenyl-phosphate phosphoribosyltransferase [Deltaproteobacteria bacterium]